MSWLPEWLSRAVTPESSEEKLANITIRSDYYGEKTNVIAQQIYEERLPSTSFDYWDFGGIKPIPPSAPNDANELSAWDRFKIAIMPESYGEALANEIIRAPVGTPIAAWDIEDFSSPNVYVKAKGAVKETIAIAGAGLRTYAAIVFVALVVLLILYVGIPALLRR